MILRSSKKIMSLDQRIPLGGFAPTSNQRNTSQKSKNTQKGPTKSGSLKSIKPQKSVHKKVEPKKVEPKQVEPIKVEPEKVEPKKAGTNNNIDKDEKILATSSSSKTKTKTKTPRELIVYMHKTKGRGVKTGLATTFKKGDRITTYGPLRLLSLSEWKDLYALHAQHTPFGFGIHVGKMSREQQPPYWVLSYGVYVTNQLIAVPDVKSPDHFVTHGPLINCGNGSENERNNCRFSISKKNGRYVINVKATRSIPPSTELCIAYGPQYIKNMRKHQET